MVDSLGGARAQEAAKSAREKAIDSAIHSFNSLELSYKSMVFDLDPEHEFKDNGNIDIYFDVKFGNIEGTKLSMKEASDKYNIEGGEARVEEIVQGISNGIRKRTRKNDPKGNLLRENLKKFPTYLKSAREEYNKATETK